jgi:hypothetical protein
LIRILPSNANRVAQVRQRIKRFAATDDARLDGLRHDRAIAAGLGDRPRHSLREVVLDHAPRCRRAGRRKWKDYRIMESNKSIFFENYGVTTKDLESYLDAALERGGGCRAGDHEREAVG